MGCGVLSSQMREVERAINALRPYIDIPGVRDAQRQLFAIRGDLLKSIGLKLPRKMSSVLQLMGLSPGTIRLWHDIEGGWMTEARAKPGSPPVYHYVPDTVALTILKRALTHELEADLMQPDEYLGE